MDDLIENFKPEVNKSYLLSTFTAHPLTGKISEELVTITEETSSEFKILHNGSEQYISKWILANAYYLEEV